MLFLTLPDGMINMTPATQFANSVTARQVAAAMWRSHADAAIDRSWISQAGLEFTGQQHVLEGGSGHALFWARKLARDEAAAVARLRTDRGQ
ncbi:MAG TPA: hypothetical protein VJ305_12725 [Streptosporangiaceae bacterium]|nr:hypothetical protein [Streptosporangiaceae bacterium]HJZ01581.1 hypothetical protein [Streptosporangiaceae bacterium]